MLSGKCTLFETASLSHLGMSSSLGRAVAKLRFDFHAISDKVLSVSCRRSAFLPVSCVNQTDLHEITLMVLKVT